MAQRPRIIAGVNIMAYARDVQGKNGKRAMMTKLEMYHKQKEKHGDKMFVLFRCDDNYQAYYDDAEKISKILSIELQTLDSTPTVSISEQQCNELIDAGYGVSRSEYRNRDGRYVPYIPELEEPLHMYEEELTEQRLN